MGKLPLFINSKCILTSSKSEMLKVACCFHEHKRLNLLKVIMKRKYLLFTVVFLIYYSSKMYIVCNISLILNCKTNVVEFIFSKNSDNPNK